MTFSRTLAAYFVLAVAAAGPHQSSAAFVDQTAQLVPAGITRCYDAATWGDYDNDGDVDLLAENYLYRNNGGTNFTYVTKLWGSSVWCDYNNDGYLDMYAWASNGHLYRSNGGTGSFTVFDADSTMPALPKDATGVYDNQSQAACWGDFNGDGYVDLYVSGYENWDADVSFPDAILMNHAGASFALTTSSTNRARGITACDFDEDSDLDVYVSNYRLQPNILWLNDGTGAFTNDVAEAYGVAGDGVAYNDRGHTIGSAWGDFDNDGHIDLFVGNFSHPDAAQDRPKFMRNRGPAENYHFELKRTLDGADWQESYAEPALADYDNDGDLDLFFTTVYAGNSSRLWRNDGNWQFTDVTAAEGLASVSNSYASAWADFDNDGDLDLVTGGQIFVNQGNANHWLRVRLEGNAITVNRSAIGAQVRIDLGGGKILTRQVEGATGKGNQNELTLHFGLGSRTAPVDLEIVWPDGATQTVSGVAVDQLVQVFIRPDLAQSAATLAPACTRGQDAASQSFEVWNATVSTLAYSITDDAGWLSVTPASGTSQGERDTIQVTYNTDALATGTYSATITVDGGSATNSPQTIAVTLTVAPDVGDLPVADSFEPYPAGLSLAGTNGWSGSVYATVVTALTYAAQTPPGRPLPAAEHTQVLKVNDTLQRMVNGVQSQNVNVDFMVKAVRNKGLPAILENPAQAGFCMDSNGVLHVLHMINDGGIWSPRWSPLELPPIGEDQWVRISATMDYSSPDGDTFFCPRFNGSLCPTSYGYKAPDNLTSPGPWYLCANSPGMGGGSGARAVSALKMEGEGWLDDVTIATNTFSHTGATSTNGVPFAWFDRWGVARLPDTDFDADGFSAVAEYAAGTDPSDADSSFRIVDTWIENNRVYLRFLGNNSGDATPYRMERSTNGLASGWTVADPAVPRAMAPETITTWSEPLQPSGPAFFRLKVPVTAP